MHKITPEEKAARIAARAKVIYAAMPSRPTACPSCGDIPAPGRTGRSKIELCLLDEGRTSLWLCRRCRLAAQSAERAARPRAPLTQAKLMEALSYNPETGKFVWKTSTGARCPVGSEAGLKRRDYVFIKVHGRRYGAHRLAWLYVHGTLPSGMLDHRDGDGTNNAIANLRPATSQQNNANRRVSGKSASGYKGVTWSAKKGRWVAAISARGARFNLGCFDTAEEASRAYLAKAQEIHGEFARAR